MALLLGFELFVMLHSSSLISPCKQLIRYDNYPPGWGERLIDRGYNIIDPILMIARRRTSAFIWSDALRGLSLSPLQRAILEEGARTGIRQGVTIPANVPGEPEGSVSFATRHDAAIDPERLIIAAAVAQIAFDAARRLAGYRAFGPAPHVSRRVRQTIYWVAAGKSDRDVADIVGVRHETIRTYVKAVFRLLGVVSRAQLVREALRLGIIDFLPSIPPFG